MSTLNYFIAQKAKTCTAEISLGPYDKTVCVLP